jgi:ABC-type uncharacterized transport system ATPase subunit
LCSLTAVPSTNFDRQTVAAAELIGRLSEKYRIHDLAVREPDIEATIRRIYKEQLLEVKD